jgi:hypothetical protein
MIKLFCGGFFALLFCAACNDAADSRAVNSQPVNFSGDWKVDSLASNFNGYVSPVGLKIVQTNDSIGIESSGEGGTHPMTDKRSLDGKIATIAKGTATGSVSAKWSGQALVQSATYHDNASNSTYEATETWTLSTDSKTLTVDRVIANDGDGGHGVSKAVYHKQ